jgi:hypothetical protein
MPMASRREHRPLIDASNKRLPAWLAKGTIIETWPEDVD